MIIDSFCFFNELDLLELRLNILDPYVDKFILLESRQTFSGQEKPLYYEENKERFAKWNDKIIHIVAPNIELTDPNNLFERHWFAYELIEKELQKYDPEAIIFSGDLDEIWNPDVLPQIEDKIYTLEMFNYSYYLNMRSNEKWMDGILTKNKNVYPGFTKKYRTLHQNFIPNAGWHFTNCMSADMIATKIRAYDHANEIVPFLNQFGEDLGIQDRIDKGYDFLGRQYNYYGVPFKFEVDETGWPEYLKDHKEEWKHLLKS